MSLIDAFKHDCVMMVKASTADGIGGLVHEWTEGEAFRAAIVKNNTREDRIAERDGTAETYTITLPKGFAMQYHDVFKRVGDGRVFRVTSNTPDSETPDVATFQIGQVTAERWDLA